MARHTQGLTLDPDSPTANSVTCEPVQIRQRSRLGLPTEVIRAVPWLEQAQKNIYCLGVFDDPGKLVLKDWETAAGSVLIEHRSLAKRGAFRELARLEMLFQRIQISRDGRMTLTASQLLHLEVAHDSDPWVFVTVLGTCVEVTSHVYRSKQIASARIEFSTLLDED
jgi:hypothetical protein